MVKKFYVINSKKKINKLKRELLKPSTSIKSISSFYKRFKNADIGKIFETNIRQALIVKYGWKIKKIERQFFYRELFHDKTLDYIIVNKSQKIKIRNEIFIFKLLKDQLIISKDNNTELKMDIPIKEREIMEFPIINERIKISAQKEIEFDGIFKNKNIDFSKFSEEVEIIYSNLEDKNINDYNYIITEIKLSANRVDDLIAQIKKDKNIMENILNKKILFVGFINDTKIKFNIEEKIKDIDFILFGLKSGKLTKRDMTQYIDWETIKEFNNKFNMIIDELKSIKNLIKKRKRSHSS